MITEIGHVAIRVRDFAACRQFYGRELDLVEIASGTSTDGHEVCMFSVGPSVLELWEDPTAPVATKLSANHPESEASLPAALSHFAFLVDSIDDAYALLRDKEIGHLDGPASTPIGHRNMQRSLLGFEDPSGFHVQISEAIDQRSHLENRRAAKHKISSAFLGLPVMLGGFDHISMFCTDYRASREFYVQKLGLEEIFHSTTREPGEAVSAGFEQGAFAIGGTDIEMATDATWRAIGPGTLRRLGFWTDDIDHAYRVVQDKGLAPDGPPSTWTPLPPIRRRAFTSHDPDGLLIQIAQHL